MNLVAKKILIIDLTNKTYDVKGFKDLNKYIGGVSLGLKLFELYLDRNPLIFTIGPLNGFFPFASKTCIITSHNGLIEDYYIGGDISSKIKFSGLDGIVIYGKGKEEIVLDIENTTVNFKGIETDLNSLGLPGKRSVLSLDKDQNKVLLNSYFTTPEDYLEKTFSEKNLNSIVITGLELYKPKDFSKYTNLYKTILLRKDDLSVLDNGYPSCSNCPKGCGKSKTGELGGNIILHSLVACGYTEKIFTDIGIVFSTLNVLGYDYTHEDIENLPSLVEQTLKNLTERM